SIVTSPNNGPNNNYLNGVTCASASECWAVGSYSNYNYSNNLTLIEKWDGTSWSIVTSPNTGTQHSLSGATCASDSSCSAVCDYSVNGYYQTLLEEWDRTSWSIVTSPNSGTSDNLYDATCASDSECWAVGVASGGNGISGLTLIEKWDGTSWSIVTSPN